MKLCIDQQELDKIHELYNKVTAKEIQITDTDCLELKKLVQLIEEKKHVLSNKSRAAKLWI